MPTNRCFVALAVLTGGAVLVSPAADVPRATRGVARHARRHRLPVAEPYASAFTVALDYHDNAIEERASRSKSTALSTTTLTTRGGAARSARRIHTPEVASSTLVPATSRKPAVSVPAVELEPTTAGPAVPAADPGAGSYEPYPECMVRSHWTSFGNDVVAHKAELVRCWDPLVRRWPWPSLSKVYSVMFCESRGDPTAGERHPYHGLMQVGPGGPFDPLENMAAAWAKSDHGTDWSQWECH